MKLFPQSSSFCHNTSKQSRSYSPHLSATIHHSKTVGTVLIFLPQYITVKLLVQSSSLCHNTSQLNCSHSPHLCATIHHSKTVPKVLICFATIHHSKAGPTVLIFLPQYITVKLLLQSSSLCHNTSQLNCWYSPHLSATIHLSATTHYSRTIPILIIFLPQCITVKLSHSPHLFATMH